MASILNNTKKILGIDENYHAFDLDVITHINSAFATLNQLGVGPAEGFVIEGPDEEWDTFYTDQRMSNIKSYIYLRVRMLFDPPGTSYLLNAFNEQIKEMEWRLNTRVSATDDGVIVVPGEPPLGGDEGILDGGDANG